MIAAFADTDTTLRYLFGDEQLSIPAKKFIDHVAAADRKVVFSAVSLAEILYLPAFILVCPSSVAIGASGLPAWKLSGKAAFGVSQQNNENK